jgi:hypothetical protein
MSPRISTAKAVLPAADCEAPLVGNQGAAGSMAGGASRAWADLCIAFPHRDRESRNVPSAVTPRSARRHAAYRLHRFAQRRTRRGVRLSTLSELAPRARRQLERRAEMLYPGPSAPTAV